MVKKASIINRFVGQYHFLSNFDTTPFLHKGLMFPGGEYAYAWSKTDDEYWKGLILSARGKDGQPAPGLAKSLGRRAPLRPGWDDEKIERMREVQVNKYKVDRLADALMATYPAKLIESNYWHDNFFGVCTCNRCSGRGQNNLGKLLMEVRDTLLAQIVWEDM